MNSPKRVLAVFSQLPLPEFAGDRQMVNNHLKNLSNVYNVTAIIICVESPSVEVFDFLAKYTTDYKIYKLTKYMMARNIIKGITKGDAIQVSLYYQNDIQQYIDTLIDDFSFVFCCNIRTAKYFLYKNKTKFIDLIDSISLNYERSLKKVHSILWKFIYLYEYKRLRRLENSAIINFDSTFLVNYLEQQYWANLLQTNKVIWVPNGIKEHLFYYEKQDDSFKNSIMFLGKMDYQPNVDAILWFINYVYPLLDESIEFYIVGPRATKQLINKSSSLKNIKIMGYLQDPYLIMKSCAAIVSPMQTGGGVQNKILEGMALAKINITTQLGARSIYFAEAGKHLLVEDNPIKMAKLINRICKEPQQYDFIGKNAKELVEKLYTWKEHSNVILQTIEKHLQS